MLEPVEIFDISLTLRILTRAMESFYACNSSTIHIQNSGQEGVLKHLIIHIIPRKPGDLKSNDQIYDMLRTYPSDLLKHYNEKMNFYVNAYANKIL
jgi:diadenosine tetraphosphate (Ap4A) HIT family hydrolase